MPESSESGRVSPAQKHEARKLLWERITARRIPFDQGFTLMALIEAATTSAELDPIVADLHEQIENERNRENQRTYPRQFCMMLVLLPTINGDKWHFVHDISKGGLAFAALRPVGVSGTITAQIADPETGRHYTCSGRVVWYDEAQERAGFQFVSVDPALGERLAGGGCAFPGA